MINLLPGIAKQELFIERLRKKLIWVFLFALVALLVLVVILFGLRAYVTERTTSFGALVLESSAKLESSQLQEVKKTISQTNQELRKIQEVVYEQVAVSPLLDKLALLLPDTVYLTGISLKKQSQDIEEPATGEMKKEFSADVYVTGISATREALFTFKQILDKEMSFKDVYFLPASWVKPNDADFSLELTFFPSNGY